MRKNRGLFEFLSIFFILSSLILYFISQLCNYAPFNCSCFIIYSAIMFIAAVCLSFRLLQSLLADISPITYDLQYYCNQWPFIKNLTQSLPKIDVYPKILENESRNVTIRREDIDLMTRLIEKRIVTVWYAEYISNDPEFPESCKELLGIIMHKFFFICKNISSRTLFNNALTIILRHIIEYQEAVQKVEKNPNSTIAEVYKMSHPISQMDNKSNADGMHCKQVVKTILIELLPTEYFDSTQMILFTNIITKKLCDILNEILEPNYLYKTLEYLLTQKDDEGTTTEHVCDDTKYTEELEDVSVKEDSSTLVGNIDDQEIEVCIEKTPNLSPKQSESNVIESVLNELMVKTTAPILQNAFDESPKRSVNASQPVDIGNSPIKKRVKPSEVKIHSKFDGLETWENDVDLANASMGQDLLASLDGEFRLESRLSGLWELDNFEIIGSSVSPNIPADESKSPIRLWFGEEENLDSPEPAELPPSSPHPGPNSNVRTESTPSLAHNFSLATLQKDIKDLQTTVTQAKHKIGDMQDEAAGMIEGFLDFGIAGLKKGLNITGLQDSPHQSKTEKDPAQPKRIIQKDEPQTSARVCKLKEQPHVVSEDMETRKADETNKTPILSQPEASPLDFLKQDSPELEYEDPADFATAIAKLRNLLQERASDQSSNDSNEPWWDGVAETRGRESTGHARAERVDSATYADLPANPSVMPLQANNNMQRLDRLLQRTVTGVFNSLKSAVGGEAGEVTDANGSVGVGGVNGTPQCDPDALTWRYVKGTVDMSGAMARMVARRRGIESAEDSLRALTPIPTGPVDELESWRIVVELVAALTRCSHVCARAASRILPEPLEPLINSWYEAATMMIKAEILRKSKAMSQQNKETTKLNEDVASFDEIDLDQLCLKIMDKLPGTVRFLADDILSESILLLLSSIGDKNINKDVFYQMIDLATLHFVRAASCKRL